MERRKLTFLDRLHPAVCFGFFLGAILLSATQQHPVYLGAGLLGALLLNFSMDRKRTAKKLLAFLPLALLVAVINPLFNTLGSTPLFFLWGRPYTLEALYYGFVIGGMLLGMFLWFSAYNAVLTDDKFSYLFGALSPSLSLLLTTVFRMIPNLTRKLKQIMGARKGIGKAGGDSARDRLDSGITAISVLTSWALEGGVTTADSMNSRGYGTGKRTCFHSYRFSLPDFCLAAVLGLNWLGALVGLFSGSGAEYFPEPHFAPVQPAVLSCCLIFLLTPTILNWKEELQWHILRSKI